MKNRNNNHISKSEIIDRFNLKKQGGSGEWFSASTFECPECGKADNKFGIKIVGGGGLCNCWRCGYKDSIFNFLYKTGNSDLVNSEKKYEFHDELDNVFLRKSTPTIIEQKLPVGFERYDKIGYLEGRGFADWQYKKFGIGMTDSPLSHGWRNKVIFQIFNRGKLVGFLGRSKKSKEYHEQNMKSYRNNECSLDIRYKNSDTDFNFILGGLDDITDKTQTVFIVEGIIDKANLDRLLCANENPEIQCVFTFGSSISKEQIDLLKSKKSVQEVILFFDLDALKKMRYIIADLQKNFNSVLITLIDENKYGPDIDAGDIDITIFEEVIEKMVEPDKFYSRKILRKKFDGR